MVAHGKPLMATQVHAQLHAPFCPMLFTLAMDPYVFAVLFGAASRELGSWSWRFLRFLSPVKTVLEPSLISHGRFPVWSRSGDGEKKKRHSQNRKRFLSLLFSTSWLRERWWLAVSVMVIVIIIWLISSIWLLKNKERKVRDAMTSSSFFMVLEWNSFHYTTLLEYFKMISTCSWFLR